MNRVAAFDETYAAEQSAAAAAQLEGRAYRLYVVGMIMLLLIGEMLGAVIGVVRPTHMTVLSFLRTPLSFLFLAFCFLASSVVVLGEDRTSDRIRTLVGGGVLAVVWLLWPRAAAPPAMEVFAIVTASLGASALLGLLSLTQGYDFISNDDNRFLEYSTPQGNVRDYAKSLGENPGSFMRIGSPDPLAWTRFGAEPVGSPPSSRP